MPRQPRVPGAEAEQAKPEPTPEVAANAGDAIRAADVDPSKIRRAVLTADGWVCPDRLPAPKE